jgi:hypothetical protein
MSLWNWLPFALGGAAKLIAFFKKDEKPTLTDTLPFVITQLFPMVQQKLAANELTTKEQIDGFLATVDASTGIDVGALEVVPNMSPASEEKFFDHACGMLKIWLYCHNGLEAELSAA